MGDGWAGNIQKETAGNSSEAKGSQLWGKRETTFMKTEGVKLKCLG